VDARALIEKCRSVLLHVTDPKAPHAIRPAQGFPGWGTYSNCPEAAEALAEIAAFNELYPK